MKRKIDPSKKLFECAEGQQGLFTAKQAEAAGFLSTNHAYHVKAGNWIRESRGIYRLALFPLQPEQQLVTYSLWSHNRAGEIQGTYSHETALAHYELTDLNPSKIHMTVPTSFRRNSEIPSILKLHYTDLTKEEIKMSRGFRITTPIRTIQDVIEVKNISFEFIEQAIKQSINRGLLTKKQIKGLATRVKISDSIHRELELVLREVA